MCRILAGLGLALFLYAGTPGLASADVITFNNRAAWNAAVAPPVTTVDFENFAADTSFSPGPLNVGPFSLSTTGPPVFVGNIVDVSPFLFPPLPASFGNAAAFFFVQDPLAAHIVFTTPVRGFFADFLDAGNGQQLALTLTFSGGGTASLLVPGIGNTLEPFGFTSTEPVTAIRLSNTVNDGFYVDNISVAQQLAIPEPSTFALLALGGLGLAGWRRWRKRKAVTE